MDLPVSKAFKTLKGTIMRNTILVYPDARKPYTLLTDAPKYAWSPTMTQEHTSVLDGNIVTHQCLSPMLMVYFREAN